MSRVTILRRFQGLPARPGCLHSSAANTRSGVIGSSRKRMPVVVADRIGNRRAHPGTERPRLTGAHRWSGAASSVRRSAALPEIRIGPPTPCSPRSTLQGHAFLEHTAWTGSHCRGSDAAPLRVDHHPSHADHHRVTGTSPVCLSMATSTLSRPRRAEAGNFAVDVARVGGPDWSSFAVCIGAVRDAPVSAFWCRFHQVDGALVLPGNAGVLPPVKRQFVDIDSWAKVLGNADTPRIHRRERSAPSLMVTRMFAMS